MILSENFIFVLTYLHSFGCYENYKTKRRNFVVHIDSDLEPFLKTCKSSPISIYKFKKKQKRGYNCDADTETQFCVAKK